VITLSVEFKKMLDAVPDPRLISGPLENPWDVINRKRCLGPFGLGKKLQLEDTAPIYRPKNLQLPHHRLPPATAMNQLLNEGKDSKQAYVFNHKQHSTIVSKARRVSKWSEHEDWEAEISLYRI
jgi:hypothetical protein